MHPIEFRRTVFWARRQGMARVRCCFFSALAKIRLWLIGSRIGGGLRVRNRPLDICLHPRGKLVIGERCRIQSGFTDNPVGGFRRTGIWVGAGAILQLGNGVGISNSTMVRIPMKADTCSNPCRTPFRSCRTVVGAKRRSESLIKGCPTGVKISPPVLHSFGAPSRGDALTIHPKTSSRRLFGRAVSGGNELPNSSSRCRRSLRVTDSPARPNRRAWD